MTCDMEHRFTGGMISHISDGDANGTNKLPPRDNGHIDGGRDRKDFRQNSLIRIQTPELRRLRNCVTPQG